jgi:hypothetical protein
MSQPYRISRGLQFLPPALWRVRTAGPLCLGIRPAGGRGESRPPGVTTRDSRRSTGARVPTCPVSVTAARVRAVSHWPTWNRRGDPASVTF